VRSPDPSVRRRAKLAAFALYALLVSAVILWALLIWHPWIDWFGRARPHA
jgi:hypothetical protein